MAKGIIFDLDGMIVHSERFSVRLAREHGISLERTVGFFKNEFQDCIVGKADLREVLLRKIPEWGWQGTLDELLGFWFDEHANSIDERFKPFIQELRNGGVYCCLATNNEKYRTENLMNERGIGKWFDAVFSSYELGCKKPEPEFFQEILEQSGIPKNNIEFWDDDPENVEGAVKFGLVSKLYKDFNSLITEIRRN